MKQADKAHPQPEVDVDFQRFFGPGDFQPVVDLNSHQDAEAGGDEEDRQQGVVPDFPVGRRRENAEPAEQKTDPVEKG